MLQNGSPSPCHAMANLACLLGKKVNEFVHLLRRFYNISSQNILVFNEVCVKNILYFWLSVKYVVYPPLLLKIHQICGEINGLKSIGDIMFCQETSTF